MVYAQFRVGFRVPRYELSSKTQGVFLIFYQPLPSFWLTGHAWTRSPNLPGSLCTWMSHQANLGLL